MKNNIILFFFAAFSWIAFDACQSQPYAQGEALYLNFCASCHQTDGAAFEQMMPPLANSDYLTLHKEQVPCIIKHGMEGEITVNGKKYNAVMGAAEGLKDVEITNIINYINNSFGNKNGYTSLEEVQNALKACEH